jgi:aminopeptidase N
MPKLPWRKSPTKGAEGDVDEQERAARMDAARAAQREGREALERAYAQWGEVSDLARVLKELRDRNHFSEQVKVMFQHAASSPPHRRG